MKKGFLLIILLLPIFMLGQEQEETYFKGNVFNRQTSLPMENVNVVNLNKIKGAITNIRGDFSIKASVNDTIHLSFLGFKSIKVKITSDMIKYPGTRIGMTELAYALEEVIITPYQLTGYLEIDAKHMPVNDAVQYHIAGLNKTYEAVAKNNPSSAGVDIFGKVFGLFSKKTKEMKKLKKLREETAMRELLNTKFDREMISEILNVDKAQLYDILKNCGLSQSFIEQANDFQIIEAITSCYDEANVTRKK